MWRWTNVPIPEVYVGAVFGGAGLSWLLPLRLPLPQRPARIVGSALLATGIASAGWAVRSAGETDVARPSTLVTTGAYAVSRNPMYMAWALGITGTALIWRAAWLAAAALLAARAIHREVILEEASLAETFGAEFEMYRARVPRYLPTKVTPRMHPERTG